MHEIEISEIPPLAPCEQSSLRMHALLNVLNVLRGELVLIGLALAENDAHLHESLACCRDLIRSLQSPATLGMTAEQIELHARTVFAEIDRTLAARPGARENPEVAESLANLASAFTMLRVRARELLARAQHPECWVEFSVSALRREFMEVFDAIEKNSRRRFKIIYNAALQQPSDYYIDLRIEGTRGDVLWLPAVFPDVIRDLTANARKYTAPGGHITAALYADSHLLRFVVEDTGRGIPPDELATVVHFGQRAKNVSDVRTMGGGFGLTKAFFVTKQFGGRFWIASQLGRGTRVRIEVPTPANGCTGG